MAMISLVGSKAILAFCNFLLLACGCTLVTGGIMVIFDPERILLSKLLSSDPIASLPQPLFYYLSLGLAVLGLLLTGTGVLGCWASCLHSYYILTAYFILVMVILIAECAVYSVAWIWPHCLGLGIDATVLVKTMQKNYGTVGEEKFTAALDLAQTMFKCCGVESANEYDTSLWRLQSLGPSLAVPLTCCKLENLNQQKAYLNPQPINSSLCQALELNRHEGFRHTPGCKDHLEIWYRQHYIVFLAVGLAIVLVEFTVLLSTILTCTKIYQYKHSADGDTAAPKPKKTNKKTAKKKDRTYESRSPLPAYSNDAYDLADTYKPNYRVMERA